MVNINCKYYFIFLTIICTKNAAASAAASCYILLVSQSIISCLPSSVIGKVFSPSISLFS